MKRTSAGGRRKKVSRKMKIDEKRQIAAELAVLDVIPRFQCPAFAIFSLCNLASRLAYDFAKNDNTAREMLLKSIEKDAA